MPKFPPEFFLTSCPQENLLLSHGVLMDESALKSHRMAAAIASKGTSPESIYLMTLRLAEKCQLQGDLLEFGAGIGTLISELQAGAYRGTITGVDMMPKPRSLPDGIAWTQADLNEKINSPTTLLT